jgi:hypothetical protein
MVSAFCLRLACGLVLSLLILRPSIIPPRFFRVQFLAALGLLAVAGYFLRDRASTLFWILLGASMLLAFAGSFVWHLDEAPGGHALILLTAPTLIACLVVASLVLRSNHAPVWLLADDLASALVLGSATTAMLMGHSYLISPAMSISPLMRLLALLGVAILARVALACVGLWLWTRSTHFTQLDTERGFWLAVRWLLGVLAPLGLGWMAWESARIRSTQSATGILYVVVIVCFLGELGSMQLVQLTGYLL